MADILTLGGGAPVNLLDKSRFLGFKQTPQDNIQRLVEYTPGGCINVPGRTAILRKAKTLFRERTYKLTCTGATIDQALANRKAIADEILAAELANMNFDPGNHSTVPNLISPLDVLPVPHEGWLIRRLRDQAVPEVWTILYGDVTETDPDVLSVPSPIEVVCTVKLALMQGAQFYNSQWFPITGVQG